MTDDFWADAEIIHSYLVDDAVRDGTMRDLTSATTLEAGYLCPVTITQAAWRDAIEWTRTDAVQDEQGRLWDVLMTMRGAAKRAAADPGSRQLFSVYRIPNRGPLGVATRAEQPRPLQLSIVAQVYDCTGSPCLTILRTDED